MKQNFRKSIRLRGFDYKADGYYFVTIITKGRANLLAGKENIVENELSDLINKTVGLTLDYKVIMPNHLHLIFILEKSELGLGEIVRRLKAKVTRKIGGELWQANYFEHIIRNEKALNTIREYIINNPLAETLKLNPLSR
ncbi:MAG: transposase [Candidatus Doudnabacteria bacterium]|nr:transposase [Candidatus Doudnabacteria bacterium]